MHQPNINCKKIDREGGCYHPKRKLKGWFGMEGRPLCKLLKRLQKPQVDKEGNVSYDDKCQYQTPFPRLEPPKHR